MFFKVPCLLKQLDQATGNKASAKENIEDTFFSRMQACLVLQGFFRDMLRSLRDSLGGSHNLSHFSSVSSASQALLTGRK